MTDSDLAGRLEEIDAMFVQMALAVEHVDGRIVLHEVSPATLYFSDRPQRVVGHIGTSDFVSLWDEGDDSFADDPPNAVLSFIGRDSGVLRDVVIEIDEPILTNHDLSYEAGVLDGALPSAAGECTLFIDPFGRPLSPMSVAGMRRRTRRRTRRRVAGMAAIV
jgi:hypothetical protein